ncbi:PKD domain-containing protein, partial [Roseateles sp. GG27B]
VGDDEVKRPVHRARIDTELDCALSKHFVSYGLTQLNKTAFANCVKPLLEPIRGCTLNDFLPSRRACAKTTARRNLGKTTMSLNSNGALPAALRWWPLPLAVSVLVSACGGGSSTVANRSPLVVAKLGSEAVLYATTLFDTAGTAAADAASPAAAGEHGDGMSGSADNHTYTATGDFSAVLTVTDNNGASASVAVPVTVTKCSVGGTQAAKLSPFISGCCRPAAASLCWSFTPSRHLFQPPIFCVM